MSRPVVGLLVSVVFFSLTLVLRTWLHWRRTGSTGFRGFSSRVGSPEWLGGVLFGGSVVLGAAGPVAELMGAIDPLVTARPWWLDAAAGCLVALGIAGTSWAQATMGASWRVGVKEDERTDFVERGPFRWVRNPIFSFLWVGVAGLALLLPNLLSVGALVSYTIAVELQVRLTEEPYLRRTHGEQYVAYCRRVGRFVPWMGRAVV